MQEKLGRRLVFFGRAIVVVWFLSVAAWLQKLDSLDLREDVHDLTLLETIDDVPAAETLKQLPEHTFDNTLEWLAKAHPETSEARVEARTRVIEWLLQQGAYEDHLRHASGKSTAPSTGALPFRFVTMEAPPAPAAAPAKSGFSLLTAEQPVTTEWHNFDSGDRQYVGTVSQFLRKLERLAQPQDVVCVVDVTDRVLSSTVIERESDQFDELQPDHAADPAHEFPTSNLHSPTGTGNAETRLASVSRAGDPAARFLLRVKSASVEGSDLKISYFWQDPNAGPSFEQNAAGIPFSDSSPSVLLPVATRSLRSPSLLSLSDPERAANGALESLAGSSDRIAYLHRAYGHLPLEEATYLASEGLTQGYRQLGLFGITFSTRRYPFAVLLCMMIALTGTLVVLVTAHKYGIPVVQHVSDEYGIDVLLASWPARCVLWAVLPLIGLWASFPVVPLSDMESNVIWLGMVALAVIGGTSLWMTAGRRRGYRP